MPERGNDETDAITAIFYSLTGRDGNPYPSKFFKASRPFGELPDSEIAKLRPQIVELAKRCFPNWTDDGEAFAKTLDTKSNCVSLVFDREGKNIIAFNAYQIASVVLVDHYEPIEFVYTHYAGVEGKEQVSGETYRGLGIMESSRIHDTQIMNPGVTAGCTASGAILKGVRATAKTFNRVMYPSDTDQPVPASIGRLGQAIYTKMNGPVDGASVDTDTLIRHGRSEYMRGTAKDPLQDRLPTNNDAILYISVSRGMLAQLGVG